MTFNILLISEIGARSMRLAMQANLPQDAHACPVDCCMHIWMVCKSRCGASLLAVMSSAMAIGTAALASISAKVWWIDPAGAILISCYIIFSWGMISKSQVTQALTSSAQ